MRLPLLLALLLPFSAGAQVGLYDVVVDVADRGEPTRVLAIRRAFAQLLFRLSGTSGLEADPAVRAAFGDPSRFLRSFVYLDTVAGELPHAAPGLSLRVSFDPEQVIALLEEARAPIWFGHRTPVLLLIEELREDGSTALIRDDHPLVPLFRSAASALGYPLVFPRSDPIEDRMISETIARAQGFAALAKQYAVRVVLAGRVRWDLQPGQAEWLLWQADRAARHRESVTSENVASAAMATLHRWLAARYAVPAAERIPQTFAMSVAGLRSAEDYLSLIRKLRSEAVFRSIRPELAEDDRLLLTVESRIHRARALDLLRLDPRLEPDPRPLPDSPADSQFVWLP